MSPLPDVTLCDRIWPVSSCSGKALLLTEGEPLYRIYLVTVLYFSSFPLTVLLLCIFLQ